MAKDFTNVSCLKNNKPISSLESINGSLDRESYYRDVCDELMRSRTIDELALRIHDIVKDLGLTDFLFMRLERQWRTDSKCGLLFSLPQELMHAYHEEHMYDIDLVLPYGKANTQPIFSSQIYEYIDNAPFELDLTQKNRRLLKLYKRFNFLEHAVLPMTACNDSGNVLLMLTSAGTGKEALQQQITPIMPKCRLLCKAIDFVCTKMFQSTFIDKKDNPIAITRKQLTLLRRLVNSDITISNLASDMCISPITAHQHIAAVRKALHVKTNIGAVVKAIRAGLVRLE